MRLFIVSTAYGAVLAVTVEKDPHAEVYTADSVLGAGKGRAAKPGEHELAARNTARDYVDELMPGIVNISEVHSEGMVNGVDGHYRWTRE